MTDEPTTLSDSPSPNPSQIGAIRSLAALSAAIESLGGKPGHARRIYRAWLGRAEWSDLAPEENAKQARLPKRLLAALPALRETLSRAASLGSRHPGADSESERLLVQLADGQSVEAVLLPRRGACVSTQIGCAVGCVFCMTGKHGLIRQLSDLEIAGQAALARALRPQVKKIVFMGMGEPSHNLANVLRAVNFLGAFGDFGHKDLVISTVGDERLFKALAQSAVRPALAVSLHAVDDEKRRRLLPRGCRMAVDPLIAAALDWANASGYPVQFEWTLMAGVNDSFEEMDALAEKLAGRYAMVNFIPVNAVPGSPFRRPEREHCAALVRRLRARGVIATLRDSAAQDVEGGCGQLRARVLGLSA